VADVADVPDYLTLAHHRDLQGRERQPWLRRTLIGLLAAFLLLGLLNVFGQRPTSSRADAGAATLEVDAPSNLRGGLIYETRITVRAHRDVAEATVVLDPEWLDGMTLNTVEPAPVGEASRNGRIAFELGHVPAGARHILFLQFQVNPTAVGRRSQDVELADGERTIATVHRTAMVWP
jgi:hypothetical protein